MASAYRDGGKEITSLVFTDAPASALQISEIPASIAELQSLSGSWAFSPVGETNEDEER